MGVESAAARTGFVNSRFLGMADVVPVEHLETRKSEILRANPPSVVELARTLSELGKLIAAREVDPFTVLKDAALVNHQAPLPRDENFAAFKGAVPRTHHVVGELFPEIVLQDEQGLTRVETILYVHVGDDPYNTTVSLGPKNQWNYDLKGQRDPNSPIKEDKWWERVVWREYLGPYTPEMVDAIQEKNDLGKPETGGLKRGQVFVGDSQGNYWEMRTLKDHFKKPTEDEIRWKEAGLGITLPRADFRDYQESLAIAKVRPDAVRLAVQNLVRQRGLGLHALPSQTSGTHRQAA